MRRRLALILALALTSAAPGLSQPAASLDELRDVQTRTRAVIADHAEATVCLLIGGATGSGVIVSDDGLVLTAAHVSGRPGRPVTLIFPDGSRVTGKTLGHNVRQDAGMVQITDDAPEGGWPFVELAEDDTLVNDAYVIALGHPGGFEAERPYVARLGQVKSLGWGGITSSCTLIGGDSGGPLFDLDGKLVGIHSRIGLSTEQNVHVPVRVFREGWDRMLANEVWNRWRLPANPDAPFLGVAGRNARRGVEVVSVVPGSAAEEAGIRVNDVITAIDGRPIETQPQLVERVGKLKVGQTVRIVILRDDRPRTLEATITKRSDADADDD
ncbi:MAG: PDZ domain-containing protein [Planctomycetes bacterium]|jgi:serine protease Do|nr:PDZ domain-containing protein [Planctomycetota bacterium]